MSEFTIIAIIVGGIAGFIMALLAHLRSKSNERPHGYITPSGETGSNNFKSRFQDARDEIKRLQRQIDELNEELREEEQNRRSSTSEFYSCDRSSEASDHFSDDDNNVDCEICAIIDEKRVEVWRGPDYSPARNDSLKKKLSTIDEKLDKSQSSGDLDKLLCELQNLHSQHPHQCVEFLYRTAKIHVKLCEGKVGVAKTEHVDKGLKACSSALKLEQNHSEVHKWYAILLGIQAESLSLKEKASVACLFKKHCDIAYKLNPNDPVILYILGSFDFEVAGLSWFEKQVVRGALGLSLDSTYDKALDKFLQAEKLPSVKKLALKEQKENKLMIAKCYVELKRKTEAKIWLNNAKTIANVDPNLDSEVFRLLRECQ